MGLQDKYDSKGNIESHNTTYGKKIHAKGMNRLQWELVAHYDLELSQMNVKMTLLNGDLYKKSYMAQTISFVMEAKNIRDAT